MELRPYQREARDAIFREWSIGRQRTLMVCPTGTGKTIIFCAISEEVVRRGGRVLILAHRGELLDQAADKMRKATGLACALEKAESTCLGEWERITVGSVQTLMRPQRLKKFPTDYYRTVIVDEAHHCHPAGTIVNGRPIELLRVGDEITSFNHTMQRLERKPITAVMSKQADVVIRIALSDNSSMTCTPDHPVWNGNSYVNAASLRIGDLVYKRSSRHGNQTENMLCVRHCLSTQIVEQHNDSILFTSMQNKSKGGSSQDSGCDMLTVRKGLHNIRTPAIPGFERKNLLFKGVQFHRTSGIQFTEDGRNKQEVRIRTNDAKQSHEVGGQPRQDEKETKGASICKSHGERILHKTSTGSLRRALSARRGICLGVCSLNAGSQIKGSETAKQLQSGHWSRNVTSSDRSRREVTQATIEKRRRQKEDSHLEGIRVVRIEVHKRGSGRGFDEVCPDGLVYNIEVADNHNFFADGILVHNCLSNTYQRVLGHFSEADVLGVTATPDRGDKQNLGQFFESLAYEYTLPAAVRDGYLCPIVAKTIPLQIDLAGVKQQNGDYQVAGLATALDPYLEQIADEMLQHKDRKIVVFLPLIATAKKFTHLLKCRGLNATEVNGESMDRAEILQRFDQQTGGILCNAMLLTEGWDCPSVDCICVLRPTRIRSLYCQMIGRGTRIHPGKENLLILDFLWHTSSHELCRPAHLICETVETASAMTDILSESAGTEMDLLELEAQAESNVVAEREEALAKKLSEMRTKKAKLVDPLQYEMSIGAEDLVDYQPAFGWEMAPASESQIEALEKNGIFAGEIANAGKASLLLDRLQKRRQAGLASPKQIRLLERMGFKHVGQWPFEGASRMISRISACGWRVPAGVVPASYQPSALRRNWCDPI